MRSIQGFTLGAGLVALMLGIALPAAAARYVPDRLQAPSVRLVGLDHAGAASLIASGSVLPPPRGVMPPPPVSKPPLRRLIFRPRHASQLD
jgi:hypothetical protein